MDLSEVCREIVINFISGWKQQKLEHILWKGDIKPYMAEYCGSKVRVTSSEKKPLMESAQILGAGVFNLCVLGCALDSWDLVGGH